MYTYLLNEGGVIYLLIHLFILYRKLLKKEKKREKGCGKNCGAAEKGFTQSMRKRSVGIRLSYMLRHPELLRQTTTVSVESIFNLSKLLPKSRNSSKFSLFAAGTTDRISQESCNDRENHEVKLFFCFLCVNPTRKM